jgi:hypothetical protein
VPAGHRSEFEQRPAALGLGVAELARLVVPRDVEQPFLDAVVEVGAPEDEPPQPVHERLPLHERDSLPVAHEVVAEAASNLRDPAVGSQLDEVRDLVRIEVVRLDQPQSDCGRRDPLLEVVGTEAEAVLEELEHVVVARRVVDLGHEGQGSLTRMDRRLTAAMVVVVLAIWLVGAAVTKYSLTEMAFYAPVAVVVVGATIGLVLLWVKIVLEAVRGRRGRGAEHS